VSEREPQRYAAHMPYKKTSAGMPIQALPRDDGCWDWYPCLRPVDSCMKKTTQNCQAEQKPGMFSLIHA